MPNPTYPTDRGNPVELPEASAVNHVVGTSAAATLQNLDVAAPSDATQAHYVTAISVGFTGTAPTAPIVIELQSAVGTVRGRFVIPGALGGREVNISSPLKMPDGQAVRLVVPAGTAGAVTHASLHYFTR